MILGAILDQHGKVLLLRGKCILLFLFVSKLKILAFLLKFFPEQALSLLFYLYFNVWVACYHLRLIFCCQFIEDGYWCRLRFRGASNTGFLLSATVRVKTTLVRELVWLNRLLLYLIFYHRSVSYFYGACFGKAGVETQREGLCCI